MNATSRRSFLKTAALAPFAVKEFTESSKRAKPLLAFSTLGCPDWPFEKVVHFAVQQGYNGIEVRGIQRELNLTKCAAFSTPAAINATRNLIKRNGLKIIDLGSSVALHHRDPAIREKNFNEGRQFIDLAMQLECPYIRVFPNDLPKTNERNQVMDLIIEGLATLGDYAKKGNVTVLLESHGDAVQTAELKHIMEATAHTHAGLLWDIVNMWSVTKEPPAQVYAQLKKFIRHTHFKDVTLADGKVKYVRFATGEAPVYEAVEALHKGGYKGYYSFEWEKLWHPEIEEPELALADFPAKMKQQFKKL